MVVNISVTDSIDWVRSIFAKVEGKDKDPYGGHQTKAEPRPEPDRLCVDYAPPRMERDSERPDGDCSFPNILKRPLRGAVPAAVHLRFVGPFGV